MSTETRDVEGLEWRPMADAPRDGTVIRVKRTDDGHELDVVWSTSYSIHGLGRNWTPPDDMGNYGDMHLTGWRPTTKGVEGDWEEALDSLAASVRDENASGWEVDLVRRRVAAALRTLREQVERLDGLNAALTIGLEWIREDDCGCVTGAGPDDYTCAACRARETLADAGDMANRLMESLGASDGALFDAEARVAELEADRDRLDWLEANGLHMTWGVVHGQGTLREAIDIARRALDTKGGE